jgi:hypothetical protein
MPTLSETFWIAFIATGSGFLLKLTSMMYKSKCKECSCFGISIKRDVELEERETEFEITHRFNKENKSENNLENV